MDVFSLLKFWRNAGVGNTADFDFTDDDEGSFFDLVFTNPKDLQHTAITTTTTTTTTTTQSVNVISSGFHTHHYQQSSHLDGADSKSNHTYSSSHSLFFNNKRKVMPLDTKTPRSPFRVLMLGFHNTKVKSDKKEIKCDIEEVTISSLLKRDDSFRSKSGWWSEKVVVDHNHTPSKRFSKDVLHRYLNLIKPLYIKVSRRSNDKGRLHDHSSFYTRKEEKASCRKHLGKSRSSSSVAKHIPSPVARRDDSALQQQDGIQSAILHCKKSYNSPSQGCHVLSRSGSAPSQGPQISIDEEKRSSI